MGVYNPTVKTLNSFCSGTVKERRGAFIFQLVGAILILGRRSFLAGERAQGSSRELREKFGGLGENHLCAS